MCIVCESKGDFSKLQGLERLSLHCTSLIKIPLIEGLKTLICFNCTYLTGIPLIKGLEYLDCSGCRSLTEIPLIEGLKTLYCYNCSSLTKIPSIPGLQILRCYTCPSLTKIPLIETLKYFYCSDCPWIEKDNPHFFSNISKLIKLQKFCRKYFPIFVVKRYIKSHEFISWFYAPENFGGFKHKKRFLKQLEN